MAEGGGPPARRMAALGRMARASRARPAHGVQIDLAAPTKAPHPERPRMSTPPLGTNWYAPVTKPRTLRIALIDDHLLLRQGLSAIIAAQPDLAVVYEGTGTEAVETVIEKAPDVAVID